MRVAIVGAGMTGLCLGAELSARGWQPTLFESAAVVGGLASAASSGGTPLERYYHHVFASHGELRELVRSLGLEPGLSFRPTRMGYFSGEALHPMTSALDLLRFRPLSFLDRLRVGLSASGLLTRRHWSDFAEDTAEGYLRRRCGARGFSLFWEPLLRNKFGAAAKEVSAVWLWDRMNSRTRSRFQRSQERLGYLKGSCQVLAEALVARIEERGGLVRTSCPVHRIEPGARGEGVLVSSSGEPQGQSFDRVIATVPAPVLLPLLPDLPPAEKRWLESREYLASLCVTLRLRRSLSEYYWINIGDPASPFAVVVEHTRLVDREAYGGDHVVYLSQYMAAGDSQRLAADEAAVLRQCVALLGRIVPGFTAQDVLGQRIARDRYTQPVFRRGHTPHAGLPTQLQPGIWLLDSSHFFPLSRCLNTSVIAARRLAETFA